MATNLVKAGHEVTVYNRSAGPTEALAKAGASVARTPADAGRGPVAMSMLADDAAVEAVVLGPTVSPRRSRRAPFTSR